MTSKHTETPYKLGAPKDIISKGRPILCEDGSAVGFVLGTESDECKATGEFIVRACNEYDELKRKADLCDEMTEALRALAAEEFRDDDDPILGMARVKARAALAKARGA